MCNSSFTIMLKVLSIPADNRTMDTDRLQSMLSNLEHSHTVEWEEFDADPDPNYEGMAFRDTYNCGWLEGRIQLLRQLLKDAD